MSLLWLFVERLILVANGVGSLNHVLQHAKHRPLIAIQARSPQTLGKLHVAQRAIALQHITKCLQCYASLWWHQMMCNFARACNAHAGARHATLTATALQSRQLLCCCVRLSQSCTPARHRQACSVHCQCGSCRCPMKLQMSSAPTSVRSFLCTTCLATFKSATYIIYLR